LGLLLFPAAAFSTDELDLELRRRVETGKGTGVHHVVVQRQSWLPQQSAVIVCDMWDLHHCLNAVRRGGEMAPRMNRVLKKLRRQGVTVIHAPSSCMDTYADHPARRRALDTPSVKTFPEDITKWCRRIPAEESGVYPIDQSDGGEDDDFDEHRRWAERLKSMGLRPGSPWTKQTDLLEIADEDYISSKGEEVWNVLEHKDIKNVILLGVHTNMCVLGRPFGLRRMARNGKNVVLMRDLTDTMYNPLRWPYVSHFTGTDLIVEHVEKYVCPTITSDQIVGGAPFRFSRDKRPHLVVVTAEEECGTHRTLPKFAIEQLGQSFRISYVHASTTERHDLPGLEVLREADVVLLSVDQRFLPTARMEALREYLSRGLPVVALRTSLRAFSASEAELSAGIANWPAFDTEILGGRFGGQHDGAQLSELRASREAAAHPLLQGVRPDELRGHAPLYKVEALEGSATTLILGEVKGEGTAPVAWVHLTNSGGRVFYTSLGNSKDFEQPGVQRLLRNAVYWASQVAPAPPTVVAAPALRLDD